MNRLLLVSISVLAPTISHAAGLGDLFGGGGAAEGGKQPFMPTLLFFGFLFVLFYVLFIAPQRKQQAKHDNMLKGLKPGDRVVTKGGVKGIVSQARDGEEFILVKVAEGVKLEVLRGSVDSVLETPTGQ
jgi:preprotein translocase subunit YajC